MISHENRLCKSISEKKSPSVLTNEEKGHLEESMRHNDGLMRRLAQL